ncbi:MULTISPECIES: class I adenylate-forming enzyme family protein [unclassified Paraburkholderia]|uniref:class I adenylate-forming enzyme family protein n=1 Tax=unclassified Paraburkholderia TaxID=2615204 RepID=UPI002AB255BD|nr:MULTISPECIES: class I adenylate-forming enzyme family protein [unclassified Paraburkholderia]
MHATYAEAGLVAQDVLMIDAANTLASVAAIVAAWLYGLVVCPVDPDTPAATKAMIAQAAHARAQLDAAGDLLLLQQQPAPATIVLRRPARVTGPDLALLIFTSGSSGTPKGVVLTHANVMTALRGISSYQNIRADDRILCVPPLFFDYGLYQLLLAMFNRCELVVAGGQTHAVALKKLIERVSPTVLPVVPALASGVAKLFAMVNKEARTVRLVTNTGGHLSAGTVELLCQAMPQAVIMPMYGLTECKRALYLDSVRFPAARDTVGDAMPALDAVLVDPASPTCAIDRQAGESAVGELYVRGASVMQGYRGEAGTAGAKLVAGRYRDDNWLATGDLFHRDAEGLLHFRGRSKSLIKQGGFCIVPRDIEIMAEALDEVIAARVVGRTEHDGDESAILYAQIDVQMDKAGQKAIVAQLKAAIPRTLMPREVRFVTEWPSTPNGKIDAARLTAMAREANANGREAKA